ncbi:MAG: ABC transporter ATP-binding protein [Paraglaciecola sp.]|uniref:ABC transporter ATP-binding protein n=1 Tax=Paraglaciecola sp. TaxID=1920173 RepID=UPI00273D323B|nr:ABC transporter ATP-binding protein [Paraglaciecola sp.]MDP5030520.1 ABC transporter ATP-binding protein [Paraglaciecola sp.]MDP5129578.1 ABC transporter ATP-binding protein [Paraglaciecola sp.]
MASKELAVDVQGLVKRFGDKVAVNDVSIQLPRGEVWGFLGPNGSGKTTTIRMICGLLSCDEGRGQCLGFDILKQATQIRRLTGYMTQKFSFWNDLTIRENLDFVARLYQLPQRKSLVNDTLEKLQLQHRQKQLAGELSGGWKQRLALAAVTMHQPQLLLLDEPTAGVDPQARRDFWDEIHHLTASGLTVLVSTHYMDEAERCDKIVYLAHGQLITQGTVHDIIRDAKLFTYKAIGEGVRLAAEKLRAQPGVAHAAYFGAALHVSGYHQAALLHAIQTITPTIHWQQVDPSLEDVFIALMDSAGADKRSYQ